MAVRLSNFALFEQCDTTTLAQPIMRVWGWTNCLCDQLQFGKCSGNLF